MRRKGEGNLCVGILESHAFRRQAIESGCFPACLTVASHVIGAQRVNGDEQNGRGGRGGGWITAFR